MEAQDRRLAVSTAHGDGSIVGGKIDAVDPADDFDGWRERNSGLGVQDLDVCLRGGEKDRSILAGDGNDTTRETDGVFPLWLFAGDVPGNEFVRSAGIGSSKYQASRGKSPDIGGANRAHRSQRHRFVC